MHKPASTEVPDLPGFAEVHGVKISALGEDGDMVILGHHPALFAAAALNDYAVDVIGLQDIYDGLQADPESAAAAAIKQGWASLKTACDAAGETEHEPDCTDCIEISEHSWYMEIGESEYPNSFPVTYFVA